MFIDKLVKKLNIGEMVFDNEEYIKYIFNMLYDVKNHKFIGYKINYYREFNFHNNVMYINFEAVKEKIKIRLREEDKYRFIYSIEFIKFKDELIYSNDKWLCNGLIKIGVYKILRDFIIIFINKQEEQQRILIEEREKRRLEHDEWCKQINKEFLELMKGNDS